MTRDEQLVAVIHLAMLTEDRSDAEQRALLAIAWECDKRNNRNTVSNRARRSPGWEWSDLVTLVHDSRVIEDGQHHVRMPPRWEETWAMWKEGR